MGKSPGSLWPSFKHLVGSGWRAVFFRDVFLFHSHPFPDRSVKVKRIGWLLKANRMLCASLLCEGSPAQLACTGLLGERPPGGSRRASGSGCFPASSCRHCGPRPRWVQLHGAPTLKPDTLRWILLLLLLLLF